MRVPYSELESADLIIDCIYESGEESGNDSDVISKLLNTRNQGGFRKKRTSEDIPGKFAYVGLEVNTNKEEWPNEFDAESGILKYYGDNNKPGPNLFQNTIHGNKLLLDVFSKLHSGQSLEDIPPFFVFLKTGERRNLRFLGLAAPGNPSISPGNDLKTIWSTINGERYINYLAYFTILDTGDEPITRQWIDSLYDADEDDSLYAPEVWKNFIENGREGIVALKAPTFCDYVHRKEGGVNKLYYGVPGSGKSFEINKKLINVNESQKHRILFHPDYTYSDFVGQILPHVENNQVTYKFTPGPFTEILEKAFHDPKNDYYLLIEEINRGNAPAIFGDIFQLLDRIDGSNSENEDEVLTKGTSEFAITNSDIASFIYRENEFEVYGNKFRIPSNLSILATMNTSDQNVFTLDTAFQRRWGMKLIPNNFDNVEESFKSTTISNSDLRWDVFCERINAIILDNNTLNLSSEDKRLGVHFVNIDEIKNGEKFAEKVLKYLWDDAFKFDRKIVFKEEYKSLEDVITDFTDEDKECFEVFKDGLFDAVISYESTENLEQEND